MLINRDHAEGGLGGLKCSPPTIFAKILSPPPPTQKLAARSLIKGSSFHLLRALCILTKTFEIGP